MRVAVFGAAGWLGRAVLANLDGRHEIRAVDLCPESWDKINDIDGEWSNSEKVHGDIANFHFVRETLEGMEAVIHAAVHFPSGDENEDAPFLVNLKGLWNVLECSRQLGVKRVVHVGSCAVEHPKGIFFTSEVRSAEGDVYGICKRLQEEMCRQFHEAHGTSIVVLRPCGIVDSRLGRGCVAQELDLESHPYNAGWVCRHDLAEACRLAVEHESIDLEILHIVGTPESEKTCNVARSREVLGLTYRADFDKYR